MKKHRLIIKIFSGILLGSICTIFFCQNLFAEKPICEYYNMLDKVNVENNVFDSLQSDTDRNGYSYTINNAIVYKYKDYGEKYNIDVDAITASKIMTAYEGSEYIPPIYVYDLEVNIENIENTDGAILTYYLMLLDSSLMLKLDNDLFLAANPDMKNPMGFKLRQNTNKIVHLPFVFSDFTVEQKYGEKYPYSADFLFPVSLYPIEKYIKVVLDTSYI